MPSLEGLRGDKETLRVDIGADEPVTVRYRPNALNQDGWERIRKNPMGFTWDQDRAFVSNQAPSFILETLVDWDLRWKLSDEQPIPLTETDLRRVPTTILQKIQTAIQLDMVPNQRRSEPSDNGS